MSTADVGPVFTLATGPVGSTPATLAALAQPVLHHTDPAFRAQFRLLDNEEAAVAHDSEGVDLRRLDSQPSERLDRVDVQRGDAHPLCRSGPLRDLAHHSLDALGRLQLLGSLGAEFQEPFRARHELALKGPDGRVERIEGCGKAP